MIGAGSVHVVVIFPGGFRVPGRHRSHWERNTIFQMPDGLQDRYLIGEFSCGCDRPGQFDNGLDRFIHGGYLGACAQMAGEKCQSEKDHNYD